MALEGHESIAVDLPGHGSRSAERFTLRSAMQTIDAAVSSFSTPPLLVGLSLGGYTSLAYAARHRGSVAGVVLSGCSTELRWKPIGAYGRLSVQVDRAWGPTDGTWHIVADMLASMKGHSSLADLRRMQDPVWLVNGQRDILRMDERRYLAALPGTSLTVVPRAGHDVNSHAPAAFNRILLGVLRELRVATAAIAAPLASAA